MEFQVYVVLEHVSGPERDQETMLDAFCADVGEQNGAKKPVHVVASDPDGGPEFGGGEDSVYLVKLVDDRKPA